MQKKITRKQYIILSVVSLLVFLIVWELLTDVFHVFTNLTLASPVKVIQTFFYKLNHK